MTRRESGVVSGLFLAAVFCASFDKVHWAAAGTVYLADVVSILFLAAWSIDRLGMPAHRVTRTVAVLIVFFFAFLLVYLVGFFNLDTADAASQFGKGIVKWAIHFAFLIVAVSYLARRSRRYYWRTLAWFFGGITTRSSSSRSPAARARSTSTDRSRGRACTGRTRSRATRTTSGSCCSCRSSSSRRSTFASSRGTGCAGSSRC